MNDTCKWYLLPDGMYSTGCLQLVYEEGAHSAFCPNCGKPVERNESRDTMVRGFTSVRRFLNGVDGK